MNVERETRSVHSLTRNILSRKFSHPIRSVTLLEMSNQTMELSGRLVGQIGETFELFLIEVALIVCNIKLRTNFSSGCFCHPEEVDELCPSPALESLRALTEGRKYSGVRYWTSH